MVSVDPTDRSKVTKSTIVSETLHFINSTLSNSTIEVRGHSSITSSKRWVGGVRKWQFLMIYSTVNHQKSQKHDDVILECPLTLKQV